MEQFPEEHEPCDKNFRQITKNIDFYFQQVNSEKINALPAPHSKSVSKILKESTLTSPELRNATALQGHRIMSQISRPHMNSKRSHQGCLRVQNLQRPSQVPIQIIPTLNEKPSINFKHGNAPRVIPSWNSHSRAPQQVNHHQIHAKPDSD